VTGTVFKRCPCPPVLDAAGRRKNCPKRHGSWFFAHDVRDPSGRRRQVRRGGYDTAADARAALQVSLTATGQGVRVQDQRRVTVAGYLEGWLERKKDDGRFRPSTALHTQGHLRDYWIPQLGHYRLADLTVDDVDRALASLRRQGTRSKRLSPSSVRRIHATLRSALNDAVRRRVIPYNPAALAELEPARRPKVRPWEPSMPTAASSPWERRNRSSALNPAVVVGKVSLARTRPRGSQTAATWMCLWVSTPPMTAPEGHSGRSRWSRTWRSANLDIAVPLLLQGG
jgi:hypothetical protein